MPYASPTLADCAEAGRYVARVLRKIEEPDKEAFCNACYTLLGCGLSLTVGPAAISTQSVNTIDTEAQILAVLESFDTIDDSEPGSVKAMGLIGDAGRRVILKLVMQALQQTLAGVDWSEIIQKFLGGVLPTTP